MSSVAVEPRGFRAEIVAMARIAVPVVAVQVGWMAMGVVDTIVVGRVSANAMAAVALGNLLFLAVSIFGMGVLMGLDPVVSQAIGAGDTTAVRTGTGCSSCGISSRCAVYRHTDVVSPVIW